MGSLSPRRPRTIETTRPKAPLWDLKAEDHQPLSLAILNRDKEGVMISLSIVLVQDDVGLRPPQ